ncbi:MAG: multidrug ABC transporter substrate-binding protein [Acidobacteria bacterium]|nr:MAG: multidrug ABC transporter substrate-binding protein [Acidobacteriota bacterium]
MSLFRNFATGLRSLFRKNQVDRELDEELGAYLEMEAAEKMRQGVSRKDALREVRLERGSLEVTKELVRSGGWECFVEPCWQDLHYSVRMLRKSPGFAAVAVLTLALGIGANTAIFSLTDQILLRELPVPHPEQLVILRSPGPNHGHTWGDVDQGAQSFSYLMYKDLRERSTVFYSLLACRGTTVNVSGHGETQAAHADLVSGNFFETLEVQPALGRLLMPGDETASGANTVAVLSYDYWSRKFGADPAILNKPLTVNGVPLTVVGVTRKGFFGVQIGLTPDIFIPVTMKAQMAPNPNQTLEDRTDHWLPVMGRLKPGITVARAEAELHPIYQPILESDAKLLKLSGDDLKRFISKPLLLMSGAHGRLVLQEGTQEPLLVLMSMVGLVLLIACANLAGLLVARGEARRREIGVRLAMGARRARLIRQLLTESLLIAIAGGAAGIALARWCLNAIMAAIPPGQGMLGFVRSPDLRVLSFAIVLTLATTIFFGLAPAMRATRLDLQSTLKDQGSNLSAGRSNLPLHKVLIVSQVALTAVLLAGAGLFARTLANLEHANLGVKTSHVLQFKVAPSLNGSTPAQTLAFADRARNEIAAFPGVRSASISTTEIFAGDDRSSNFMPEGYSLRPGDDTDAMYDYIGPNYFSTMGIPLIAGREFSEADTATSPKVCIINEKQAQRFFVGRNPIGLHMTQGSGRLYTNPPMEIVGVVANSKWDDARSDIVPFLYMPYSQDVNLGHLAFYVRTERDPAPIAAALRSLIQRLDPNLPVNNMRTLEEQVSNSMLNDRLVTGLSVSLALLAALLAALGLYGVLAYVVARRTREIGIRIALGGERADILGLVVGQGVRLTLGGGAIGLVAALVATRLVASLLYGVTPHDPLTFVGVVALLAIVSGAACYIPARRAMRVDPMIALRYE